MSQSDSKQGDGKKSRSRKSGGAAKGDSPPARPSGLKPSTVKEDLLPKDEQVIVAHTEPPRSGLPQHLRSWLVMGLGVVVLLSFVALNQNGGKSGSSSTSAQIVVPEAPSTTSASPAAPLYPTEEERPPSAAPKPSPPKKVWEHEITVAMNTSFNIDKFPVKNLPTGFEVSDAAGPGEGLEVVSPGKEISWHSGAPPNYKNCHNTLGSTTGSEHITLESSGQWICVETSTGRIGRLRFDGASGNSYSFLVAVWRP